MKTLKTFILMLVCLIGFSWLFAASGITDDHRNGKKHFEREDQHPLPFMESDNKGNEIAGQIAAWLLLAANLTVVISLFIKETNHFASLEAELKILLTNFNRFQKKYLMPLHYYLNPVIVGIIFWHWHSSRCKSTALPELGAFVMIILISFGIILKFKLCPKALRKNVYQIHTHPILFLGMVIVLTIGHAIID